MCACAGSYCLPVSRVFVCLSVCLSVCVRLSIYLFIHLSVCLCAASESAGVITVASSLRVLYMCAELGVPNIPPRQLVSTGCNSSPGSSRVGRPPSNVVMTERRTHNIRRGVLVGRVKHQKWSYPGSPASVIWESEVR